MAKKYDVVVVAVAVVAQNLRAQNPSTRRETSDGNRNPNSAKDSEAAMTNEKMPSDAHSDWFWSEFRQKFGPKKSPNKGPLRESHRRDGRDIPGCEYLPQLRLVRATHPGPTMNRRAVNERRSWK